LITETARGERRESVARSVESNGVSMGIPANQSRANSPPQSTNAGNGHKMQLSGAPGIGETGS